VPSARDRLGLAFAVRVELTGGFALPAAAAFTSTS
jgi:hypothetical protein